MHKCGPQSTKSLGKTTSEWHVRTIYQLHWHIGHHSNILLCILMVPSHKLGHCIKCNHLSKINQQNKRCTNEDSDQPTALEKQHLHGISEPFASSAGTVRITQTTSVALGCTAHFATITKCASVQSTNAIITIGEAASALCDNGR